MLKYNFPEESKAYSQLVDIFRLTNIPITRHFTDKILNLIRLYNILSDHNVDSVHNFINVVVERINNHTVILDNRRDWEEFYREYITTAKVLRDLVIIGAMSYRKLVVKDKLSFLPMVMIDMIIKYDYYLEGKLQLQLKDFFETPPREVVILSDGRIVCLLRDSTIGIWNSYTGELEKTITDIGGYSVLKVLSSNRIITLSSDNKSIIILNIDTEIRELILNGHIKPIKQIEILPDGRIVSMSISNELRVWNLNTGNCDLVLSDELVNNMAILPNGNIVTGLTDGVLKIWNINTGKLEKFLLGHTKSIIQIKILPNGKIVSISHDHTLRVWNPDTGEAEKVFEKIMYTTGIIILSNNKLITGFTLRNFRICDLKTGEVKKIHLPDEKGMVRILFKLPDNRLLIGVRNTPGREAITYTLEVYNFENDYLEYNLSLGNFPNEPFNIEILPDRRLLIVPKSLSRNPMAYILN